MSEVLLAARNVSKNFGGLQAVRDVSIDVCAGTIHALIGPNGAGKTTFFNTLSGYYYPDAGTVTFRGADITHEVSWKRIRRGMSRTFQTPSIFPELSVHENLMIGVQAQQNVAFEMRVPSRSQRKKLEERVDELLGFVNLTRYANRPVAELSHGSQRLCEIAMSLTPSPVLVLLDEPMAGLAEAETTRVISTCARSARPPWAHRALRRAQHARRPERRGNRLRFSIAARSWPKERRKRSPSNEAVREAYLGREVIAHV